MPGFICLLIKTPFENQLIEFQIDEESFKTKVSNFETFENSLIICDPFTIVRRQIKNLSNGNNIDEIKQAITLESKFINQQDLFGNTLLMEAVRKII